MQKIGKIAAMGAAMVMTALALTACGQKDTPAAASRECTADDVKTTGKFGEAPTITIPGDCTPPKKLITKDLSEGTGEGAKPGQQLEMNYTLVTWSDKQKLDSSFDRGKTFPLPLGAGKVIQGWDQGLVGIKQGARRLLIIPPDLGYGQGGQGIKPNETLVFVTDAVKVSGDSGP
ncbi:FKBP-type peptidyl-prolyl cis-trans isomerase [Amycolatopsis sp. NPDC059021]|uniref:FKBP-type peptidyl-prolyl cis-trans isomerase n=1 Tax=Amycolatopsis sp. NPDC059021 TaxID=3346704 RepID=UPI0036733176